MLSIEVTTKCNLKCRNCFAHAEIIDHNHMAINQAKAIANEGIKIGYDSISLTGGEVLLWPHIFVFIAYLKEVGYKSILINSNFHLLSSDLCEKFIKYKDLITLSCSINGFKEEHDHVRGAGSFETVKKGLKVALKYALRVLVYTVVNKRNLYDIPRFTQWINKEYQGVDELVFIQLRGVDNDYYNVSNLKLNPREMIEFVKMISYLSLGGYKVHILENSLSTVVAKELGFQWYPKSPEISRKGKIVVLENGMITDNHSSLTNLGMYGDFTLKDILDSKEYHKVAVEASEFCNKCKFLKRCSDAGKLRPSDLYHNTGDNKSFFCQKVMELVDE